MPEVERGTGAEAPELIRTRQLFRFLKAFAERRVPIARTLSQHAWTLTLRELPAHPSVTIGEVVLGDEEPQEEPPDGGDPLLRVTRPSLSPAPRPPEILVPHLATGWESATGEILVIPARNLVRNGETLTEIFEDDTARVEALSEWRRRWQRWAEAERPAVEAMRIFERL